MAFRVTKLRTYLMVHLIKIQAISNLLSRGNAVYMLRWQSLSKSLRREDRMWRLRNCRLSHYSASCNLIAGSNSNFACISSYTRSTTDHNTYIFKNVSRFPIDVLCDMRSSINSCAVRNFTEKESLNICVNAEVFPICIINRLFYCN